MKGTSPRCSLGNGDLQRRLLGLFNDLGHRDEDGDLVESVLLCELCLRLCVGVGVAGCFPSSLVACLPLPCPLCAGRRAHPKRER